MISQIINTKTSSPKSSVKWLIAYDFTGYDNLLLIRFLITGGY